MAFFSLKTPPRVTRILRKHEASEWEKDGEESGMVVLLFQFIRKPRATQTRSGSPGPLQERDGPVAPRTRLHHPIAKVLFGPGAFLGIAGRDAGIQKFCKEKPEGIGVGLTDDILIVHD